MQRRNQLRGISNRISYLQNQAELREVGAQLRASTSTISQNLKDQPTLAGNMTKIHRDRAELSGLLSTTVGELSGGSFATLMGEVEARLEQQRLLGDTRETQELTSESLRALEQELEREWDTFREQDEVKKQRIQALTHQLKHQKKVTALTLKYEEETARANAETLARLRGERLAGLRESIAAARARKATDDSVHAKTVEFLNRQKDALETLGGEWEARYQADYTAKCQALDELTALRSRDKVLLEALQERWHAEKEEKRLLAAEAARRANQAAAKKRLRRAIMFVFSGVRFYLPVYKKKLESLKKGKKKGGKKASKKK